MPLHGLISDSPLFYYGGKAVRSSASGGRHGSGPAIRGPSKTTFTFKAKGLVLYPEFYLYINSPTGAVGRYMAKRALLMKERAKHQAGYKTGNLRRSIYIKQTSSNRGHTIKIGADVNYAMAHHEGTRPHTIVPKTAPELVFRKGSRIIHTRLVHHPGSKANPFLRDQLRPDILR
jgi:hypothetical protein